MPDLNIAFLQLTPGRTLEENLQMGLSACRQAAPAPGTARALLVQYLALNLLFLPLCGVSTALACLAGQL